ncbi:copper resistance CopC family protein [Brachybacterium sp. Z12]|uniref:copper resistance CopC family protein n=1 Tax=Brachybacterium sp. Z12 TaxID=2759167 RepID=UPI00223B2AF6|nr:copper resistance CopC family protein [Brachybacterium sp. Z12]
MMSLTSRSTAVHPVRTRPASLLALCGALLLAALLALPAPAQAHDTLLSSDPEDGATLETSPEEIALTYSADILEVSPLVRITDESGTELAEIVPTVEGPVATATLTEPLPAGTHTVQWRVVSSDGHPIEGTFTLTVEQDPAEVAEPSDGGGDDAAATGAAEASDAGERSRPHPPVMRSRRPAPSPRRTPGWAWAR